MDASLINGNTYLSGRVREHAGMSHFKSVNPLNKTFTTVCHITGWRHLPYPTNFTGICELKVIHVLGQMAEFPAYWSVAFDSVTARPHCWSRYFWTKILLQILEQVWVYSQWNVQTLPITKCVSYYKTFQIKSRGDLICRAHVEHTRFEYIGFCIYRIWKSDLGVPYDVWSHCMILLVNWPVLTIGPAWKSIILYEQLEMEPTDQKASAHTTQGLT